MTVDHGVMQPVDFLLGKDNTRPIIPVFVNAIAHPLTPMKRVREMGEAFGKAALQLGKRVLFIASGGISHSPPIPRWESAPAEVKARLVSYAPTPEQRRAREKAIVDGIQKIADGKAPSSPLNEAWDTLLLDTFRSGDLSPVDSWDNEQFIIDGGSAAHEMRSWIAAYAALSMAGKYKLPVDRYWAVKTWGAGFAVQAGCVA
jgi:2,3-dihydroxyphenylpropionate 1,2-dioxygenase